MSRTTPNPSFKRAHPNVYCSISTAINITGRSDNYAKLIKACPDDRLLIESDFPFLEDCEKRTWDMVQITADLKGWRVEEEWEEGDTGDDLGTVKRLSTNWRKFMRFEK
jgi:hypothetical protein